LQTKLRVIIPKQRAEILEARASHPRFMSLAARTMKQWMKALWNPLQHFCLQVKLVGSQREEEKNNWLLSIPLSRPPCYTMQPPGDTRGGLPSIFNVNRLAGVLAAAVK
jgi:hypothetical protein